MRSLWVFVLLVSLGGCASMVRSGAIMRAQDNYMDGDYQDAIGIVDRSLTSYDYDDEGKAQLLLVKAQSYEKLNELDAALATARELDVTSSG